MYLFNTTFIVDTHAVSYFRTWVSTCFIPKALTSSLFFDPLLTKIIQPEPSEDNVESYALQFKTHSLSEAQNWKESEARNLFGLIQSKYPESVLQFSTFMEII